MRLFSFLPSLGALASRILGLIRRIVVALLGSRSAAGSRLAWGLECGCGLGDALSPCLTFPWLGLSPSFFFSGPESTRKGVF